MTTKPATPTLDKRSAVIEESNSIGQFLDWLAEQGIALATYRYETYDVPVYRYQLDKDDPRKARPEGMDYETYKTFRDELVDWETRTREEKSLLPIHEGFNALLHRYFDIDPDAEEAELRSLLEYAREMNQ